jgi:glutathione S-transferase
VRFRGYGPALDETARAYLDVLFALPAMREWMAAAAAEPERVESYQV